ncbi:MAG TPA: chromosome segregation protein SMC, partial [Desulfobacterales bacterium]|nr:chromosome segregation protein SMC [Desulfobacterales bacterium]
MALEVLMKIRRLAIVGFKSFMDKVEISFPEGISAIVGPNGCGKSNIVDAIRWCMGEQSTKQLRARHMEDVIFSGAGNHKPLGMAEVTLVLEGGGEGLPEDLAQMTEISITRRLYRSGESEYLLNGLPCRLRDIQELFMDTGLGNRAYSVIGQGRIGAILEQKPEETRVMLEEAAGITKYRKKVEASQKKISLTQSNLQRLEDIMSEVQRQIRSLKRQASKARRYKRLTEEIRNLELTLYSNLLKELSAKAGERERKARELVEQEALLSAKVSNWQSKLDTLRLELE